MSKLLILQGLQGSGKTTFAKNFCEENKNYVRINRDDLRNMRGVYWLPSQENLITKWQNFCIVSAIGDNYSVVLDDTNLNKARNKFRIEKIREQLKDLGYEKESNFTVEYKFFDVSVEECIKRDAERIVGKVGEKVIRNFYNKYLAK